MIKKPTFLLDMVHHNPGEPPFSTQFTDPAVLADLGFTGQVFKHINACIPGFWNGEQEFPISNEEKLWLREAQANRDAEISAAVKAGVKVFYHVDLFVLPTRIIDRHRDEICDEFGNIDLTKPATLALHRQMLEDLFDRYPDVNGLIIRVGETYLFDTPFHSGNAAVALYDKKTGRSEQIRRFVILLNFLREEICVRHQKILIHRTWDMLPNGFHASLDYYVNVTDAIEPHPNLLFSIKHTTGDFFRGSPANPCLGSGKHSQIVEVQCQREYEGKGAYPSYIARGVIEGFPEVAKPIGLRHWSQSSLWNGVWTWSRGGGWYGPYLKNEFWCELNLRIIAAWTGSPERSEEEVFREVCMLALGMDAKATTIFRELCLVSEEAIWLGRSSSILSSLINGFKVDVADLWMRDDRLGGFDQIDGILNRLHEGNALQKFIDEKRRAVALYEHMADLARRLHTCDPARDEVIETSVIYGERLFRIIAEGWELMIKIWLRRKTLTADSITPVDLARYQNLWTQYRALANERNSCASLYEECYWSWPGSPEAPGMTASIQGEIKN